MSPDAKDALIEEELQKGLKAFIRDGLTTEVMAALTGGVFLVAFALIIALMVLSQLSNILFLRIWGNLTDRFSNKSVLGVSGPLFLLCIFAWTYTILPERRIFTILLLVAIHIFAGISTAGVTLASGNIGLKLAPKGQATAYLAANGLINSLAAGFAPILGGILADIFTGYELFGTINWRSPEGERVFTTFFLQGWGFLFLLAALTGLYSIHRLAIVKEIGEVEEKIVMLELIAEVERGVRTFPPLMDFARWLCSPTLS